MLHGNETTNGKKRCLRVNEQGFISLYAMLLLLIFLCFITLFVQRTAAYAAACDLQESYDLYAIHSCREYLEDFQKQKEETKTREAAEAKLPKDHEDEEAQQKEELPQQWERLFRNAAFQFTREEDHINVTYAHKNQSVQLQVIFDKTDGSILEVVYL